MDFETAHQIAVDAGKDFYLDPRTGLSVMTKLALIRRGYCCENKCRHCPYPLAAPLTE